MTALFLLTSMTGFLLGGTVSALALTATARVFGWPMRFWAVPLVLFASYVAVYFIGKYMVRTHVGTLLVRGVIVSSGWFSVTVWITVATSGALQGPAAGPLGGAIRITLAWFLVLIASATLLFHRHRALS